MKAYNIKQGELTPVYSVTKGLGAGIVDTAIALGAKYLDCFEGYCTSLYSRHGFVETSREANWGDGPDVVYMSLGE